MATGLDGKFHRTLWIFRFQEVALHEVVQSKVQALQQWKYLVTDIRWLIVDKKDTRQRLFPDMGLH